MESSFLAALFAGSIAINLMAAVLVLATGRDSKGLHPFYSVVALCVTNAAYQYCNWRYHASLDTVDAVLWLKWQLTFVALLFPSYFHTFSIWSRRPKANTWLIGMSVLALILIIVNWLMPFGVRFSEIQAFREVTLFNGEVIHVLDGEISPVNTIYHGIILVVIGIVLLRVNALLDYQLRGPALSIIAFILLQLVAILIGALIDKGVINSFYVAGFTTTLLILFICINLSLQVRKQTALLNYQVSRRQKVEKAIAALAAEVSKADDKGFYEQMVLNLQLLFETKTVFVGLYQKDAHNEWIETLAVTENQTTKENFQYPLRDTPCEQVVGRDYCVYNNDVIRVFPKDRMLVDMGIESYIGMPMFDSDNAPLGLIALLHDAPYDISEEMLQTLKVFAVRTSAELSRNRIEKRLRRIAYFDYTTGLPNRTQLFETINNQYRKNQVTTKQSVLLLFDLDHFKDVNRIYGYDIAEDVLKEVGTRLAHYSSDNIFIARHDGDEFAAIIKQVDTEAIGLIKVNWEALQAIIKTPIEIDTRQINLECSMGAVVFPRQTGNRFDVLRSAESALQQAKRSGRGRCEIFDPELQKSIDRRFDLETKLKQGLKDKNQFKVVYQPQTNAKGELLGGEVLVRWHHPDIGFVSPAEFIPIAEQAGIIHKLGDWILDTVIKQLSGWLRDKITLPDHISINVSALQLSSPDFVERFLTLIERYEVPSSLIVLELTESGLLENMEQAITRLKHLQRQGIRIALDDFGTGYSSLSYLKDLPLDIIKIDKSFIDELFDTGTREMIESIISIGAHMHLEVIAEGTESIEQVTLLEKLGCHRFQGYYFSKPLPPSEFIKWKFNH